jgi:hypothetical protein
LQPEREFLESKRQQNLLRRQQMLAKQLAFRGGGEHARYATKSHGAIAAKHRASEVEIHPGT